ncbi:MAG: ribonuclease HI family protein [Candidatus Liptonbacteria bacterium]|nr:ribonuclease HI family protein [Candidatus Liptonbacteria bacterium]
MNKKEKPIFGGQKIVAYTDGGARGNPGPAAIGVVVGEKEYSEYIGEHTNNRAEYEAVVFALKKIKQLIGKTKAKEAEVEVRMDSELVVRQLTGKYKILEEDLQPLFLEVWNLRLDFKNVDFVHIPREQNKKADKLVNRALDAMRVASSE